MERSGSFYCDDIMRHWMEQRHPLACRKRFTSNFDQSNSLGECFEGSGYLWYGADQLSGNEFMGVCQKNTQEF